MATFAASLTASAFTGPSEERALGRRPTFADSLAARSQLDFNSINPTYQRGGSSLGVDPAASAGIGSRNIQGLRAFQFVPGPSATANNIFEKTRASFEDLIPSIETLLTAQEERIIQRLQQELRSQFELHRGEFSPKLRQDVRAAVSCAPKSDQLAKSKSDHSAVSYDCQDPVGSAMQRGAIRFSPSTDFTVASASKSLPSTMPSSKSSGRLTMPSSKSSGRTTGSQSQKSPDGNVSNLSMTLGGHMWWREPVVQTGFARVTTMLSSYIESKGWMKKTPLSKAAMKEVHREKTRLKKFILGSRFDTVCATMIITNSALLGYQVEYLAVGAKKTAPEWCTGAQVAFTVWFTVELLLRIWATGIQFVFTKEWRWNIFDVVIVSISVIELFLQVSGQTERNNMPVIRLLRILRLVNVIRMIRVVRFFSELRLMVYSTMKSLKPFFWALCLLLLLVYIVGVQITQTAVDYLDMEGGSEDSLMREYFGTLHASTYTLFQVVSGGLSWREPADVLLRIHWGYGLLMAVFVSFTVFAVLNIVTGVFVGTAMQSAQQDQDVVIQDAMNEEDSFAREVLHIFEEADTERKGYITSEQFEAHLKDQRVRAYLHHLALDVAEARGLFDLLDICNTGRVSSHEFLLGCMRLKGPARNVDMATLLYENKRMMNLWMGFMSFVEEQFNILFVHLGMGGLFHAYMSPVNTVPEESATAASGEANPVPAESGTSCEETAGIEII